MNLENFDYVLKVLEMGSISAAAKKLYMSQPLLSQKIKQIESELNISIFNRNTSPISLTPAGECFINAAKKISDINRGMLREIDEINGECKGALKVGISTHRAAQLLPRLLSRFIRKYPLVKVQVVEHTKSRFSTAVANGDIDLAFVSYNAALAELHQDKLHYIFLDDDRLLAVAGTNTALARAVPRGATASIRAAQSDSFVSVKEVHGFRESQNDIFRSCGIAPDIALEVDTIELACKLAYSCDYVSLLPLTYRDGIQDMVGSGFFCQVQDERHDKRSFGICYRKKIFAPRYMMDFISCAKILYRRAEY